MYLNKFILILSLFFIALLFNACGEADLPIPKPRAFPKVNYPQKAYQNFDKEYCSFSFQYPTYASIQQDTLFFEEKPVHPCWFDLYIEEFNCRLHCSYYPILEGEKSFDELKKDAFELVDWHNKRANYIDELLIEKSNDVSGMAFSIEGPAASPFQFFLTDKEKHFFRGALYFNTQIKTDSLAPIYDFVKEDIFTLLESFEWSE